MALNHFVAEGRIAFDLELKGNGDRKYMTIPLSVKRNYKPEGEQYYPEDLIYCKVFGKQAEVIAQHFNKNDNIIITGRLQVGNEYTNNDGQLVKPGLEVIVSGFEFLSAPKNDSGENKTAPSIKAAAKPNTKKPSPLAPKKKLNPLSA